MAAPKPSKGRKYTQAEMDAINNVAPAQIDVVNQESLKTTKEKVLRAHQNMERATWNREYKRKLT